MSKTKLPLEVRRKVAAHFQFRCAYCQTQEAVAGMRFTVDHIFPEILGGSSEPDNLCLACWDCNLSKGARIAAMDTETHELVPLFQPRKQAWVEHFQWQDGGTVISGRTAIGRATVAALELNRSVLVRARQRWVEVGWHPPP